MGEKRERGRRARGQASEGRDVNGTDNFRPESASVSVFKDMVCNYGNPPDTDADKDIR